MEKIVLGVILAVAVAVLARMVWRSVARASDPTKPPSCGGCPFDSKCQMQDQPHLDGCGSSCDDS